jgi:hypothetical protein
LRSDGLVDIEAVVGQRAHQAAAEGGKLENNPHLLRIQQWKEMALQPASSHPVIAAYAAFRQVMAENSVGMNVSKTNEEFTAVQQKQERWRANNAAYSTDMSAATGLDIPTSTANGFYTISIDAADATSYTVRASAVGGTSQAEDGNCSQLRVRLAAGNQLNYGSASSGGSTFDESVGNRCWSR